MTLTSVRPVDSVLAVDKFASYRTDDLLADAEGIVGFGTEMNDKIAREPQEGNIEYKYMLVDPSEERLQHLTTQMKWRVKEGNGEAFYAIGVEDNGTCRGLSEEDLLASLNTLQLMSEAAGCDMSLVQRQKGREGWVAEVLVRQRAMEGNFIDLRIAVVGNVDSGKSTLVGVLTSGKLDNGRGFARSMVFRHRHEIETGRTSSITQQIMGITASGDIVNYDSLNTKTSGEIVKDSSKVVTFIDLAGHERYIKTTVYGMTGCVPDYAMVVVGANMGVQRMTKEHLGVALALKCAFFFVVTKVDMCPEHVLKETVNELQKIVKAPGIRKIPVMIRTEADVIAAAKDMANGARVTPIFLVSNVSGHNLDLLRLWFNSVPAQKAQGDSINDPAEFYIDDTFSVPGVGTVVGGTLTSGSISLKSSLVLGPDSRGIFQPVQVKSIMNKSMPVNVVAAGQTATLAVKKLKRSQIRKGMVITEAALQPKACLRFTAEVIVLHHPTTITVNYQPVVHSLTVRQACRVVSMDKENIRTGDRAMVTMEFLFRPEYMVLGARLIFREGRTKGIGKVVGLHFVDGTNKCMEENVQNQLNKQIPQQMSSSSTDESLPPQPCPTPISLDRCLNPVSRPPLP